MLSFATIILVTCIVLHSKELLINSGYMYIFTNSGIKASSLRIPSTLCPWLLLSWQNPDHKWIHAFIFSCLYLHLGSLTIGWTNVTSSKWSLLLFSVVILLALNEVSHSFSTLGITNFLLNQWLCLILIGKTVVSLAKNSLHLPTI